MNMSNKEINIIPINNESNDILVLFTNFLTDYFKFVNKDNYKIILFKRFSLDEDKKYTLEEIGIFFGITRERVRQLENKILNNLKDLFNGQELKREYISCNKEFVDKINSLREKLLSFKIINQKELYQFLKIEYEISINKSNENYLKLLMFLFGFDNVSYEEKEFFIQVDCLDIDSFIVISKHLTNILQKNILPMNFFNIVIELKKKAKNLKISNEIIQICLDKIEDIEKLETSEGNKYQLKFEKLNSLSDYSYRILNEKNENMHFSELWREILHKLSTVELNKYEHSKSLNNQLVSDKRFVSIGKTGEWGLSSWNINTSSIIELVISAFRIYNKPLSYKEITEYVIDSRKNASEKSILSIISQHRELFLVVDDKFILKEWSNDYTNAKKFEAGTSKQKFKSFDNIIVDIFNESSEDKIQPKDIRDRLKDKGLELVTPTFYAKLNNCVFLDKEVIDFKTYYFLKDISLVDVKLKESKLEKMRDEIISLFKESNTNQILLYTLVAKLEKNGYARGSIYHVVSKNKIFKKIKNDSDEIILELFEE